MKYTLSIKDGRYCLEAYKVTEHGFERTYTNNQEKIFQILKQNDEKAHMIIHSGNDIRMYYQDHEVILKDYKHNKDKGIYACIMNRVGEKTKDIKLYHQKTLAILAATGGIALFSIACPCVGKAIAHINSKPAIEKTEDDVNSLNINIVAEPITLTPTPTPTPVIVPEDVQESTIIPLATNMTTYAQNKLNEFYNQVAWQYIEEYSAQYGVDSNLLVAIAFTESSLDHENLLPGGSRYNGHAVGMFQHEDPDIEHDVTAYNYNTNQYDTDRICMDNACDLKENIKLAAMLLQNRLHKYHNNIYLTIQSYNYGNGAMSIILDKYANEKNKTVDEIIDNYADTGWLEYVTDLHNNPNEYLNWKYKTYGNDKYLETVLGYFVGKECVNKNISGEDVVVNLETLETNTLTR